MDDSPPPDRFTPADQCDRLLAVSQSKPDLGFIGRLLTVCCLPRTDPGQQKQYRRDNGPFTLYLVAGAGTGLPFGNIPRLLLAWICTEVVRRKNRQSTDAPQGEDGSTDPRVLVLGRSVSGFMRTIGIYSTGGGKRGERTRLRDQMNRLFRCHIELVFEDSAADLFAGARVTDYGQLWWDVKDRNRRLKSSSRIRLSEVFYQAIQKHHVPVNLKVLGALKSSSLGLDLYTWLNYRIFTLTKPLKLSWRQIYQQLGFDPAKAANKYVVRDFRRQCLRELRKIRLAWPEFRFSLPRGALIIHPSKPSIPPRNDCGDSP